MPWITSLCVFGSMSGVPAWWRSKISPFGVMMPGWCCSGVMLQSDRFCRFLSTSVRRRLTCASNFEGMPYAVSSMTRPGSWLVCGTGSGAARAPPAAANAPPVSAAVLRRKFLRGVARHGASSDASSREFEYAPCDSHARCADKKPFLRKHGASRPPRLRVDSRADGTPRRALSRCKPLGRLPRDRRGRPPRGGARSRPGGPGADPRGLDCLEPRSSRSSWRRSSRWQRSARARQALLCRAARPAADASTCLTSSKKLVNCRKARCRAAA